MKKSIFKTIRSIIPAIALAVALTGCVREPHGEVPDPSSGEEMQEVTFTLAVPGHSTPTRSMAGPPENEVKSIDIFGFVHWTKSYPSEGATPGYTSHIYDYEGHFRARIVSMNPPGGNGLYTVTVRVKLPQSITGTIVGYTPYLLVVANMGDFDYSQFSSSGSYGAIGDKMVVANTGKWAADGSTDGGYRPIPMAVYAPFRNFFTSSSSYGMTRMLARIDVHNNATAEFTLKRIHLYNRNTSGLALPYWKYTSTPYVKNQMTMDPGTINIPGLNGRTGNAGKQTGQALIYPSADNETPIVSYEGEIYTFESAAADGTAGDVNATCLVLEGEWQGVNQFYRVDFVYPNANPAVSPAFMALHRNYRYQVNINAVSGPGYNTPEEALRSRGLTNNFKTYILSYNEGALTNFVYNNSYYLGLVDGAALEPAAGSKTTALCLTDYPYGWQINTAMATAGIEYDDPLDEGWLSAVKSGVATDVRANIALEALSENTGASPRTAYVHIIAGTLRHKLKVIQLNQ